MPLARRIPDEALPIVLPAPGALCERVAAWRLDFAPVVPSDQATPVNRHDAVLLGSRMLLDSGDVQRLTCDPMALLVSVVAVGGFAAALAGPALDAGGGSGEPHGTLTGSSRRKRRRGSDRTTQRLTLTGGRISSIEMVADPARLDELDLALVLDEHRLPTITGICRKDSA
jgi:hypothetical protein